MNDTIKNRTSIVFHQIGVSSQQVAEQDFAINKKGVAIQCSIHNTLANIPILSVLIVIISILRFINYRKCKYYISKCNHVAFK